MTRGTSRKTFSILILLLAALATGCNGSKGLKFADLSVDPPDRVTERLRSDRLAVSSTSMFRGDLQSLVGLVVIFPADASGGKTRVDRFDADPSLRPAASLLEDDLNAIELYRGRVQGKVEVGGTAWVVKSDKSAESVSEILIEDAIRIGFKDLKQIPFDQIRAYPMKPDFDYYYVEAVVLTRSTTRVFNEVKSGTVIAAPAFGANGKVFASSNATQKDWMTSLVIFDLRSPGLRPGAEGTIGGSVLRYMPVMPHAELRQFLNAQQRVAAQKFDQSNPISLNALQDRLNAGPR